MPASEKTLVMIFPPLTVPTSPPLGACLLKAYIEKELPQWRVKVLDLNLWTFDVLLKSLHQGRFLNPEYFPEGALAEIALANMMEVFRGRNDSEFYGAPEHYEVYADLLLRFVEVYSQTLAALCRACDQGAAMHPLFRMMLDRILAEKPDCVGISLSFSQQVAVGSTLGRLLRKDGAVKVILGGSVFGDSAADFMEQNPQAADFVVSGEGEEPLKRLLADLASPENAPGTCYYRDGVLRENEPAVALDLDRFPPPDFGDLDLPGYYSPEPVVPLLLSRGCYWRRCAFCVHYRSAGHGFRAHGVEYVLRMLQGFASQGIRNFAFIDEMISPRRFELLAGAIKDAGLDIAYYALAKPVRQFTPEVLALMAESGCKYILWGVESGSQRVLDLMDKGTRVEDVSSVLRAAHAAVIANHVYVMCGFPTETLEEFAATIGFLDRHKAQIYAVHRGNFALERKSPVFDQPEKFGVTRVWQARNDAFGGRWEFECSSGMTAGEAKQAFENMLPFLRAFSPFTVRLANFRDHALLVYRKGGQCLRPEERRFPRVNYPQTGRLLSAADEPRELP